MTLLTLSVLLLAAVLIVLGVLHVYWALGGKGVAPAVVPERDGAPLFTPGPLASLTVAALLFAGAAVALGAGGVLILPLPPTLLFIGVWGLGAVFLARGVGDFRYVGLFKRVRGTRFATWDTWLYSPLCLAMAALAFVIALGAA